MPTSEAVIHAEQDKQCVCHHLVRPFLIDTGSPHWIVGRLLYRPFTERRHERSTFDGKLRGQQARLNDGN